LNTNYWTNDVIDPDQKTGFVLFGEDQDSLSYYTRYNNPKVNALITQGRTELDTDKRRAIYAEIQETAKNDVHWIDMYYSPFRNASWNYVSGLLQNPMGRFMLETTSTTK
jgi:peptide/nickel transport system substrate-binding protein